MDRPDAELLIAGTSPRVRGKRPGVGGGAFEGGYIPACAGEAGLHRDLCAVRQVHPRVCGGSAASSSGVQRRFGTSPRVRGKRGVWRRDPLLAGYIPACAGEAAARRAAAGARRVHPRVCGGSTTERLEALAPRGTSPRVRGKRPRPAQGASGSGYIPACAGEARRCRRTRRAGMVHPRVCGGSASSLRWHFGNRGTSPRVRGKLHAGPAARAIVGYIPACAGEAACVASWLSSRPVHPRVCGGSAGTSKRAASKSGTSPRVRGKLRPGRREYPEIRYIPACAGEARRGPT